MTVSDDLARLSVRAEQAEDRAAAAKAQARDWLGPVLSITSARVGWRR
jgi:hypothetical protein